MEFIGSSFRDPSGNVFSHQGVLYRSINDTYRVHYQHFNEVGLYRKLVSSGAIIPHEEVTVGGFALPNVFKIIKPVRIRSISYPYEWSFSQLQDAALTLLNIQNSAMEHGMILKDATPFNMQFLEGRPILIDTLSFKKNDSWQPWVAYRQFCESFLAPLALAAYCDPRLLRSLRLFLGGMPLEVCVSQMPWKALLNPGLFIHLFLHSRFQDKHSNRSIDQNKEIRHSKRSACGLVESLKNTVSKLKLRTRRSEWSNYYAADVEDAYFDEKKRILDSWIPATQPTLVWDLGANTGAFSRLFSRRKIQVLAFDRDCLCVERNYLQSREDRDAFLLPLCQDLMNPSPACGWRLSERMSWLERSKPDLTVSLALIHHLALGENLPLDNIASFYSTLSPWLIMEFVPKEDANAQRLLANKGDIFPNYNKGEFENRFRRCFDIVKEHSFAHSKRTLFLLRNKDFKA